jgi:hypothetical protein
LTRFLKYIGTLAVFLMSLAAFLPWVFIESKQITVTGMDASGTNFGRPAYFHLLLALIFLFCTFIQRVGAKRLNLMVTAINIGWAIRNYFMISACSGGECPVKKIGLWLMVISSILMLISALFPDLEIKERT